MPYRKPGVLTIKEKKLVKNYIDTGSKTEAALKAYDTKQRKTAYEIAKRALKRPVVHEYLVQMLEKKGLSLEDLGDKLHSAINKNLKEAKPSMAVGADLLKFSFKLLDAVPSTKSVNTNLTIKQENPDMTSFSELEAKLQDVSESINTLLNESKKGTGSSEKSD